MNIHLPAPSRIAVACLLLAACGGPPAAAPSAASTNPSAAGKPAASQAGSAAAAEKVRGAWVAVAATQAPLWAAQEGAYFGKQGLNAENTLIRGSGAAVAALNSQNVDIVQMSGPGLVNAVSQGADAVMIAGFVNVATYKVMADPSIKSMDDLKGKVIAVSQIGGQDDFILRKVLKTKGIAPDEVKIVQTKDIPGSVAALNARQVQAAILAAPEHVPAIKAGAHEVLDVTGLKIPFASTGLVTTHAYLKDHRKTAISFLKATVDGIRRVKTDRPFTDAIYSKYLSTSDPDVLQSAWDITTFVFEDKPYPSVPGLQEVIDENDVKGHKPEDFADFSLVKELDDSGYLNGK